MSLVNRALWIIDRNLGGELTLPGLAETLGVGRHHLAHAFAAATGLPVMAYVRRRRLSEAAEALARGAGDILDLALESGYGSHEAFTRAFKAEFGQAPQGVREAGSTGALPLLAPLQWIEAPAWPLTAPRLIPSRPINAAGLSGVFAFDATEAIPTLWRRFMPEFAAMPNRTALIPVGVVSTPTEEGAFAYLCAAEVESFRGVPAHIECWPIPAATYAVFDHAQHVSALNRTYAAIWNGGLADFGLTPAEAAGLERHGRNFDPATGLGGMEVWIAVDT
ncbi:AraC family transcriptional regulator [Phenylobacterium montanum]|uniref:AraC family transcriptional regulator n=1 Tax=Phenylobacterium montanum TaxID=2823693 RepID=A0A975FWX0_9CAUL|nr:helix-turn-helix domain-containing protein [Caulobacter sp. S6]QUD86454.1 AraC family transcriptional regulator [Caulobacter sp. S6]